MRTRLVMTLAVIALLVSGCGAFRSGMSWFEADPLDAYMQGDAEAVELYRDVPFSRLSDGGFVLGDPDALITIVEFADFACPHCQAYHPTMKQLIEDYVVTGMAKLEYRMFISAADPTYGPYTAQLAECADQLEPGAFWRAHDAIFDWAAEFGRFNETITGALAQRLGLDSGDLIDCAAEADQWQNDVEFGSRLGVQATPTIMYRIGDTDPQFITAHGQTYDRGPVPYEVLRIFIEENQPNV